MSKSKKYGDDYHQKCPEKLPAAFGDWLNKLYERDKSFLYAPGKRVGYCTICGCNVKTHIGKKVDLYQREYPRPQQYHMYDCPACETNLTAFPEGSHEGIFLTDAIFPVRDRKGRVWFRVFAVERPQKQNFNDTVPHLVIGRFRAYETHRFLVEDSKVYRWILSGNLVNQNELTWDAAQNKFVPQKPRLASKAELSSLLDYCVYDKNFKRTIRGTKLENLVCQHSSPRFSARVCSRFSSQCCRWWNCAELSRSA
jgi:hypothetical protein